MKSHAQYWECQDCYSANCERQSSELKVKCKMFGFEYGFGEGDVISGKGNNDGSKDRSENWGRA